jgi:AcrR family transcriptional regulator
MANQEAPLTETIALRGEKLGNGAGPFDTASPVKAKLGRPSQRNPGETKTNILSSALKCFTEKGYAATTFAAVARGAGLTGPAIYQYFDSKGALYAATREHIYEDLVPDISTALIDNNNFKDRLRQILQLAVNLHESNPAATAFLSSFPVEVRQEPKLKLQLSNSSSSLLTVLTQVFDDAKSAGEISSTRSTESLTMFFFGSVMGLCLYHHASQKTAMHEAVEVFFDVIEDRLLSD